MYDSSSFGEAVFVTGNGVFAWPGGLGEGLEELMDKFDGFSGMAGFDGEPGRLWKVFIVGVIGVLDGRSNGTVKFRKEGSDVRSFGDDLLEPVLSPVGTEGRVKAGFSSSSSMDGKA